MTRLLPASRPRSPSLLLLFAVTALACGRRGEDGEGRGGAAAIPTVEDGPPAAGASGSSAPPSELDETIADAAGGGHLVTIKLSTNVRAGAHVFWGRKDLGVAPLSIERPQGSGPLDLLVLAPGFLPLHTRAFTDRDESLTVRLYSDADARGLLGYVPAPTSTR